MRHLLAGAPDAVPEGRPRRVARHQRSMPHQHPCHGRSCCRRRAPIPTRRMTSAVSCRMWASSTMCSIGSAIGGSPIAAAPAAESSSHPRRYALGGTFNPALLAGQRTHMEVGIAEGVPVFGTTRVGPDGGIQAGEHFCRAGPFCRDSHPAGPDRQGSAGPSRPARCDSHVRALPRIGPYRHGGRSASPRARRTNRGRSPRRTIERAVSMSALAQGRLPREEKADGRQRCAGERCQSVPLPSLRPCPAAAPPVDRPTAAGCRPVPRRPPGSPVPNRRRMKARRSG